MEQPQQQPTLLPPEEMREEQQQQQQPAEEAEGAPAAEQKQQPTSLGFLQLQDAFKRMVAVGVDVVDQEVRRRAPIDGRRSLPGAIARAQCSAPHAARASKGDNAHPRRTRTSRPPPPHPSRT